VTAAAKGIWALVIVAVLFTATVIFIGFFAHALAEGLRIGWEVLG
jgi:hypothetical protein